MWKVAGLALCGLLAMKTAQAADCSLKQVGAINIQVSDNQVRVPVLFGDTPKNLALVLDAGLNGIFATTAKELDLHTRRVASSDSNFRVTHDGQSIEQVAVAPVFQIGQARVRDVEFAVIPPVTGLPPWLQGDVVGDIGTVFFANLDFELDLAQSKLNLFLPDHCPGQVVYWTKSSFAQIPFDRGPTGSVIVDMQLDGKPVRANMRAFGPSMIGMNTMRRLFGLDETAPGMSEIESPPGGHKRYRYTFKNLTTDGLTVANPEIIVFGQDPDRRPECDPHLHFATVERPPLHSTAPDTYLTRCFGSADLILGMSVLSKLHMYFSSQEKTLYLTGADTQ